MDWARISEKLREPRKGSQWSHAARLLQTLQEDYLRSASLTFGDLCRKKLFRAELCLGPR